MTKIFIDIETCPSQSLGVRADIAATIEPPGNISKAETIAAWHVEKKPALIEEQWRKTSFDGALGHICVIGLAFDDESPISIFSPAWQTDEAVILAEFFTMLDDRIAQQPNVRPTFIGHNVIDFDLRFIFQRAVMLGIRPSRHIPFAARPWDDAVFDTMTRWAGTKDRVKLDKLAKAMGLQLKGSEIGEEIDGSKVWDFVRDGRIADVAKYCLGDIERTRGIYRRMTFEAMAA
jgi:3'-5' exonuclease